MTAINPKQLPIGRIAIGAGSFAAPNLVGSLFGFAPSEDQGSAFALRLFAIRDLAIGLGTIASAGEAQALWWRLGILCDAGDALTGYLALKSGAPKRGATMTVGIALSAVALGVVGARSTRV